MDARAAPGDADPRQQREEADVGDIGTERREVEFEPLPEPEPAVVPAPAEPEPERAPA